MKIVAWLSVLTEHQSHTFRHLGVLSSESIEYVLGARTIEARKGQGWTEMSLTSLSVSELPNQGWWEYGKKIIKQFPDAVHIFNGMWADRRFLPLLLYAQWRGVRTCLITEPYADSPVSYFSKKTGLLDRIRSAARPWVYKIAGSLVARRMTAVFAISVKAVDQFVALGFHKDRVFPFGYFVPVLSGQVNDPGSEANAGRLRLVFVGSLIERKGLSTLVEAIELCIANGHQVAADIYGPGETGAIHAPDHLISYRGIIPFGEAQGVIRKYDLLVVPSLHDGWAVVVNEALLQGIPVMCSDAVGAGVLVQKSGAGCIFPSSDAKALASLITDLLRSPGLLIDWRSKAAHKIDWLSPAVAAEYQMNCLQFALGKSNIRPSAPWYP
jgi:glycosyltransferase involved in cell wall biosynthesis